MEVAGIPQERSPQEDRRSNFMTIFPPGALPMQVPPATVGAFTVSLLRSFLHFSGLVEFFSSLVAAHENAARSSPRFSSELLPPVIPLWPAARRAGFRNA